MYAIVMWLAYCAIVSVPDEHMPQYQSASAT
jgi:hypothetical protein